MKCPKCDYEDMEFSLPANVQCPECGYEYRYKRKSNMITNWLIGNRLALYVSSGIVVYITKQGRIGQGMLLYFVNDDPVWSRPLP